MNLETPLDGTMDGIYDDHMTNTFCLASAVSIFIGTSAIPSAPAATPLTPAEFISSIEKAHGTSVWDAKSGLEANILVEFGGKTRIDGKLLMEPWVGRVCMELKDGTVLVWDERKAWVSPSSSEFQGARFHLLT